MSSALRDRLQSALGASFSLDRELGGGGMARVFVAEDRALARTVVVKVLPPDVAADVSAERFGREVRLAARLQHPHIVPVLSSGQADGLPYYVMPFVEGQSLRARLERDGALPVRDAISILRDITKALAFAHAQGIVHRDIKPDNILLAGDSAVVTDFGIAKAISASLTTTSTGTLTRTGTSIGTPAYMAPEQAAGDPQTDHRADIYALGVVAFEMLAGRTPFTGRTAHELVRAHIAEPAPSLAAAKPGVPPALVRLVERCLAKDPAARPRDAAEVLAALDDVPTGSGERATNAHPARRRGFAAAAAAIALLAVAVTVFIVSSRGDVVAPPLDRGRVGLLPIVMQGDTNVAAFSSMTRDLVAQELGRIAWLHGVRIMDDASASRAMSADDARRLARRLARHDSAATLVGAAVYPSGDSLQIQFRVLDGSTGETIRALTPVRVSRATPSDGLQRAIDPLTSVVGYVTHPMLGAPFLPLGQPPRFDALAEVATALEIWSRLDTTARFGRFRHLTRAIELDSTYTQAWLWRGADLVRSSVVPFRNALTSATDTALLVIAARRDRLSPLETTFGDYVTAAARAAPDASLDALRTLSTRAPRSVFAEMLPTVLADRNQTRAAATALREWYDARRAYDGPRASLDHDYYVMRSQLDHYGGDDHAALDAARRALAAVPSSIEARRAELDALAGLGDSVAIVKALDALPMAAPSGSTTGFVGDVLLQMTQELTAHGHRQFGAAVMNRAVAWFDARPSEEMRRASQQTYRAALAYYLVKRYRDAEAELAVLEAVSPEDVRFIGLRGRIAAVQHDTVAAKRALARLGGESALERRGAPTLERATILAILGHRDDALELLQSAFQQGQSFYVRERLHWFTEWQPLKNDPRFRAVITPVG